MNNGPAKLEPLDEAQRANAREVAQQLQGARRLLFITGAGMSADSGLPTYRGVGGLYNDGQTVDGLSIEQCLSGPVFRSRPELTWKYLAEVAQAAAKANYNRGHEVLAALQDQFDVWVLTQNIDGFHTLAGSRQVIEIHGTMRRIRCTDCNHQFATEDYQSLSLPPHCKLCSGLLRPDVVLFEEMLPEHALQNLYEILQQPFDATLSIGTTSAFPYIAEPVRIAAQAGRLTVEINPATTAVSKLVDIRCQAGAAAVLDAIWCHLAAGA